MIVGETCCTYIPDNDNEGHVIEAGIKKLTFMSKTLTDRETTSGFFGLEWFKGIFTNVTNVMLMVICTVCSGLLILCLWPCIRALIRNAVSSTFKSSTAGAQTRRPLPPLPPPTTPLPPPPTTPLAPSEQFLFSLLKCKRCACLTKKVRIAFLKDVRILTCKLCVFCFKTTTIHLCCSVLFITIYSSFINV